MTDEHDGGDSGLQERRRSRNRATLWIALALMGLLFAVTLAKLSENVSATGS
ncbi:MAG: hypothetical protein AAFV62_15085 [Pseudomonadota bacterium]